jgi:3-hydroxyisobutyrate dehydrogenase and related beta-hydroxyacid dehydrogenases
MPQQIGFIGLGDQGGPMAHRIVDGGFPLMLWARRPESLEPYRDTAATYAASVADLGASCDIVGLCVFADKDVEQMVSELLPAMRPGSVILIHSTASPDLCARLAGEGSARGIAVLDAPVSGGNARAANGELAVMVGGDPAAFERVQPVLATFAKKVVRLGEAGAGQTAKLINNAVVTIHFATALAFFDVGEKMGLDRTALAEVLSSGSAQSFGIQQMAGATPEILGFVLPRLDKDVQLMLNALYAAGLGDTCAAQQSRRGAEDFTAYAAGR